MSKQTPESKLTAEILLWCGQHDYIAIRQQSGKFYTRNGHPITIGFVGLSDWLIISPTGQIAFVELKVKPNKPSSEQLHFIDNMHSRNVRAAVVYSVDDLKKVFEKTI